MIETKELELIEDLSPMEKSRLRECEDVIRKGFKSFVDVGRALMEIRDSKLYRETHGTFEAWLSDLDVSRSRAYDLIHSHTVYKNLSAIADKLPENEAQARPLAPLEPQAQRYIWQDVIKQAPNGKITAKIVEQHVKAYLEELHAKSGGGKGGGSGSNSEIKILLGQIHRSLTALKDPDRIRRARERILQVLKEELGAVEEKTGEAEDGEDGGE